MTSEFKIKKIFELEQKLTNEIAKLLISKKYKYLDKSPAERFGMLIAERVKRPKWAEHVKEYLDWFFESYPHSDKIKKNDQQTNT